MRLIFMAGVPCFSTGDILSWHFVITTGAWQEENWGADVKSHCVISKEQPAMRIRDIVPVRSPKVINGMTVQRQQWARPDVEIEVVPIERGPFSMEFATEEVLAGPYILEAVRKAENDGCDAVVLDCCVDPVLRAARETVRIPVLAPAHSGLHVASMLGYGSRCWGCAMGSKRWKSISALMCFSDKICSMHTVDMPAGGPHRVAGFTASRSSRLRSRRPFRNIGRT